MAAASRAVQADPATVYEHTNRGNTIAVVSDGTRVLGLGRIGPTAAMPVMEGKALLFKCLGGVDAVPICLATSDANAMVQAVTWLQPSFGGINLEDISQPTCFDVLDRLRATLEIPVWHDDQQGTAMVLLGLEAQAEGVAQLTRSREELERLSRSTIEHARRTTEVLMREALIRPVSGPLQNGARRTMIATQTTSGDEQKRRRRERKGT